MTTYRIIFLIAAAIIAVTASCELIDVKEPDPPREPDLIGPTWQLRAFDSNGTLDTDLDDRIYSIQFQSRGAAIRSDCNQCTAAFERGRGGDLSIDVHLCTEAACPPGTRTDEYVQRLREVHSYEIDGRTLRLFFGENGNALVHFARPR